MELEDMARSAATYGAVDAAHELAEQAAAKAHDAYDQIREAPGRTEDWVEQQLAEAYLKTRDGLASDLGELLDKAATSFRLDEQNVFGTGGMEGDTASLAISRRDAGDRAAQLVAEDDLTGLLARAERAGDEPLARAVAERALDLGYADVINKFLERRPQLDEAATRLWEARTPEPNREFSFWMTLESAKPSELRKVTMDRMPSVAGRDRRASTITSTGGRNSFQANVIAELGIG